MTDESPWRRKSTPGDATIRRSILDLALSMDPNIKIEPQASKTVVSFSILNPEPRGSVWVWDGGRRASFPEDREGMRVVRCECGPGLG